MSSIHLPGMTAENSLYKSRTQYNVAASQYYQKHCLNSTLLVQNNAVPQMKATLFSTCNNCSLLDRVFGSLTWCWDYDCDTEFGECYFTDAYPDTC
jgi:hypothetical protein